LDIGKSVRFKNLESGIGASKRDHTYTIIGVQKIFDGRIAYRVTCNEFEDRFGCPALPAEIEFIAPTVSATPKARG
jgi:hypothetical protein